MGSILKYRLPNESPVIQFGRFEVHSTDAEPNGFIISDFLQNNTYVFRTTNVEGRFHFSESEPFVVGKEEYLAKATSLIKSIQNGDLQKVVLSRVMKVDTHESALDSIFDRLDKAYPKAFVYLVSDPKFGTWAGATPERLLFSDGSDFQSVSLAGTKTNKVCDRFTTKEEMEQKFVTDFISDELKRVGIENIRLQGPEEYEAGPVKHLRTNISFVALPTDSFRIVKFLHPTPAVSGLPRDESIRKIIDTEFHERHLYSGYIGLIQPEKTRLFVNLRCCQFINNQVFLYLGGGLTADSLAEKEWEETENKSRTLLNIL